MAKIEYLLALLAGDINTHFLWHIVAVLLGDKLAYLDKI